MKTYYIMPLRRMQVRSFLGFKGGAETIKFDFSTWAADNSAVTAVTWTVKSGQVSVTNKSLSSNIATGTLVTDEAGGSLIEIKATTGNNEVYITHLNILTKDPYRHVNDYGFVHWA